MKITLLVIGKTEDAWLREGIQRYVDRLKHYVPFQLEEIPALKQNRSLTEAQQKTAEGELLLKKIAPADRLVLLDEKGKTFSSEAFSAQLQQHMNGGLKQLTFVVGGPYGFSDEVYRRANEKISLSAMTFSHQMVRLFFTEQLYRAFTILRNEPYHHR